jgi:light-regulated signal transduction histidine kinase (bacteriophytochrome)
MRLDKLGQECIPREPIGGLSSRALQDFCLAVSHDLTEPLRGASCYLELLKHSAVNRLSAEELGFLQTVEKSLAELGHLVKGLQDLIKVSGADRVALSRVDCGLLARRAISLMHLAVAETHAEIEVCKMPTIDSNEALLLQVFQNLIGNALKFSGKAPPLIRISCAWAPEEWIFAISDNGIGIDASCLEYIFQPLKRLDGDHAGAGLGLTVCRLAVEELGGRIWVESTPGYGSTFYFAIPHSEPSVGADPAEARPQKNHGG